MVDRKQFSFKSTEWHRRKSTDANKNMMLDEQSSEDFVFGIINTSKEPHNLECLLRSVEKLNYL